MSTNIDANSPPKRAYVEQVQQKRPAAEPKGPDSQATFDELQLWTKWCRDMLHWITVRLGELSKHTQCPECGANMKPVCSKPANHGGEEF